jgi:hypothetical protein
VFFVTSALLLINAVWVYFEVYKRLEKDKNLVLSVSVTESKAVVLK